MVDTLSANEDLFQTAKKSEFFNKPKNQVKWNLLTCRLRVDHIDL